jgi:hypothetical protein
LWQIDLIFRPLPLDNCLPNDITLAKTLTLCTIAIYCEWFSEKQNFLPVNIYCKPGKWLDMEWFCSKKKRNQTQREREKIVFHWKVIRSGHMVQLYENQLSFINWKIFAQQIIGPWKFRHCTTFGKKAEGGVKISISVNYE